jgi:hypothetical protein
MFLNGLNDDIQFQLLNTDYANFQHMVDKAIVIKNKIKEMENDDKRKVSFHEQRINAELAFQYAGPRWW